MYTPCIRYSLSPSYHLTHHFTQGKHCIGIFSWTPDQLTTCSVLLYISNIRIQVQVSCLSSVIFIPLNCVFVHTLFGRHSNLFCRKTEQSVCLAGIQFVHCSLYLTGVLQVVYRECIAACSCHVYYIWCTMSMLQSLAAYT